MLYICINKNNKPLKKTIMKNAIKDTIKVIEELDVQIKQNREDDDKSIELLKARGEALKLVRTLNKLWK